MNRVGTAFSHRVRSPLRTAWIWTFFLALLLFGPVEWVDYFWFLRALRAMPVFVRLTLLAGPWFIIVAGVARIPGRNRTEHSSGRMGLLAVWVAPLLFILLWLLRDRQRVTGDAAVLEWTVNMGATLRFGHAPLTHLLLNKTGHSLAYALNMQPADGVALCVAGIASVFVLALSAVLRPLPCGRRWPLIWLVAGSSLWVLAAGQIEVYFLPAALQTLFLYSILVWCETGENAWLPAAIFPAMILAGFWTGIHLPVFILFIVCLWRKDIRHRARLLAIGCGGVGFVILFFVMNPVLFNALLGEMRFRYSNPGFYITLDERLGFTISSILCGHLNIWLVNLAPLAPLVGAIRGIRSRGGGETGVVSPFWFCILALGFALPLELIWRPWLGFEGDIDLYSFLMAPAFLCAGAFLIRCRWADIGRHKWVGLFLLGFVPAAGEILDHCQFHTQLLRVQFLAMPERMAVRPREMMLAGDLKGALYVADCIDEFAPRLRPDLLEFLDENNIQRLAPGGAEVHKFGWAQDILFWEWPETVLVADAWGRLFRHRGDQLEAVDLEYSVPRGEDPIVAMARGPGLELYLLRRNGVVIHGHQPVDAPLGSWTWRSIPPPKEIKNAWPADQAVDLAYDSAQERILILDRAGGLHVAAGKPLNLRLELDFDAARSLLRLEDGWCVATEWGGCHPLRGEGLGYGPEILLSTHLLYPAFMDALVEPDGRGRVLLDYNGVLHPIAEATLFQTFYPDSDGPPFRRMTMNPFSGKLALLDAMYGVHWVEPDADGVMALHRIVDANEGNARAALQFANRVWMSHTLLQATILELIAGNPTVLEIARKDPLWWERLEVSVQSPTGLPND